MFRILNLAEGEDVNVMELRLVVGIVCAVIVGLFGWIAFGEVAGLVGAAAGYFFGPPILRRFIQF